MLSQHLQESVKKPCRANIWGVSLLYGRGGNKLQINSRSVSAVFELQRGVRYKINEAQPANNNVVANFLETR